MSFYKVITAGYLLLEQNNKVLLLRRLNTGYRDGEYSLVSGHGDAKESPRQTVIREAKEEAGIQVLPEDLKLIAVVSRVGEDEEERINFFWKCEKWTGEIQNMEPEKCSELEWYDKNSLPDNLVPELKVALSVIDKSEVYDEFDWNK